MISIKKSPVIQRMGIIPRQRYKYAGSILILILFVSVSSIPSRLNNGTGFALAASDPVIAAAGDIACDPANPNFNGGNGTATDCREKYTSDLLVNAGLAGVLMLVDA